MQTRTITLANAGEFSYIGIFSGGNVKPEDITDLNAFKKHYESRPFINKMEET